jgi:hypothetical protein
MNEVEQWIRQRAPIWGVDPDVAVKVAKGEGGLMDPYRHGEGPAPKSQDPSFGKKENSFGPLQLYISGNGAGLGDRALAAGIDPRKDWKGGIDFGLREAAQKGWGQWYGAKAQGITGMMGINGNGVPGTTINSMPRGMPQAPALPPPTVVADHPIAGIQPDPTAIAATAPVDPSGKVGLMDTIAKLTTEGANGKASPLGALASLVGGGGSSGGNSAPPQDQIIQTGALQSSDAMQQSQMANAQQLMQTLLAKRRKPVMGMQIGGMPGMMG